MDPSVRPEVSGRSVRLVCGTINHYIHERTLPIFFPVPRRIVSLSLSLSLCVRPCRINVIKVGGAFTVLSFLPFHDRSKTVSFKPSATSESVNQG